MKSPDNFINPFEPPHKAGDSDAPSLIVPSPLSSPSSAANACAARIFDVAHKHAKIVRGEHYNNGKDVVWHSPEELALLYDIAAGAYDELRNGYVLQCGIFGGASACTLGQAIKETRAKYNPVIAIDIFRKRNTDADRLTQFVHKESWDNLHAHKLEDHLIYVTGHDVQFITLFWRMPLQMAFIDTSHSYQHTVEEIHAVLPYITNQGWLLFDDYFSTRVQVREAVDGFFCAYTTRAFWAYEIQNKILCIKFDTPI